jgi:DNA-binding FadR family transcriptional regulator
MRITAERQIRQISEGLAPPFRTQLTCTAVTPDDGNLREAAERHRLIYKAIRARKPDHAQALMNEHLLSASAHLAREEDWPGIGG